MAIALTACGASGDNGKPNHGYGWDFDAQAESDLRVRWNGTQWPSLAYIDELYSITAACVGETAPAPLVIFVDEVPDGDSVIDVTGLAYLDTGTVVIQKHDSIHAVTANLRHEFVHWLLHYSGALTVAQQSAHDSPLFLECVVPTAGTPIAAP